MTGGRSDSAGGGAAPCGAASADASERARWRGGAAAPPSRSRGTPLPLLRRRSVCARACDRPNGAAPAAKLASLLLLLSSLIL